MKYIEYKNTTAKFYAVKHSLYHKEDIEDIEFWIFAFCKKYFQSQIQTFQFTMRMPIQMTPTADENTEEKNRKLETTSLL